jgi:outer membrane lipoprotein-sorting protein
VILLLWFSLAGVLSGAAGTQQSGDGPGTGSVISLNAALAGMDQAAARFTGVTGNLDYTKVTVIVNDHSTDRGTIAFEKKNGKTRVMLAFREPAEKFVLFEGNQVSLYRPKIAEVEVYEIGGKQGLVEQFLLLGFGTAGSELQKNYQITWRGEASLDPSAPGERVVHMELVPKSEQAASRLKKIELWLSPETWQPVQQKFWEPSGDYMIARYTGVKLNPNIPDRTFRLPLKGNVKTVKR